MERRLILQLIAAGFLVPRSEAGVSGLIGIAPAQAAAAAYKPLFFTPEEMATLDRLTEILIPAEDHSPGASEALVNRFLDVMVSDHGAAAQRIWRNGLQAVDAEAQRRFQKAFRDCAPGQQDEIVATMASNELDPQTELERFFRTLKRMTLHVYTTLLGAAARCWDPSRAADALQAADPYMTLVGYFNSLRELGGTARLVEDQVLAACASLELRKPVDFAGPHPWLAARKLADRPVELTSRLSSDEIKRAKAKLAWLAGRRGAIDVALASNMIGTGVDIDRLGLIVIAGQPKSTSDYIQGSSRVGRDDDRPGLVVTMFNMHKPRDRSHYEHFGLYHETFYRAVESKSVTPFSLPALDRGLTGVLMAMVRLENQAMTAKDAVLEIPAHLDAGRAAIEFLVARVLAHRQGPSERELVEELAAVVDARARATLDAWVRLAEQASTNRVYSAFDVADRRGKGHEGQELLRTLERDLRDPASRSRTGGEARFAAPTSMRDVEPVVHLWVRGRH